MERTLITIKLSALCDAPSGYVADAGHDQKVGFSIGDRQCRVQITMEQHDLDQLRQLLNNMLPVPSECPTNA